MPELQPLARRNLAPGTRSPALGRGPAGAEPGQGPGGNPLWPGAWRVRRLHARGRVRRGNRQWLGPDTLRDNRMYVACQTTDDIPYVRQYVGDDNIIIGTEGVLGHRRQQKGRMVHYDMPLAA